MRASGFCAVLSITGLLLDKLSSDSATGWCGVGVFVLEGFCGNGLSVNPEEDGEAMSTLYQLSSVLSDQGSGWVKEHVRGCLEGLSFKDKYSLFQHNRVD